MIESWLYDTGQQCEGAKATCTGTWSSLRAMWKKMQLAKGGLPYTWLALPLFPNTSFASPVGNMEGFHLLLP